VQPEGVPTVLPNINFNLKWVVRAMFR